MGESFKTGPQLQRRPDAGEASRQDFSSALRMFELGGARLAFAYFQNRPLSLGLSRRSDAKRYLSLPAPHEPASLGW
jgi:hypothetical protein